MQVPAPTRARKRAPARELALVGALALVLVCLILRPWPIDEPIAHFGDTFQHLALIEASDWTGSPGTTDRLNAPHGLDWSVFPTGTERLPLAVMHALRTVTGDVVVAMNLYVLAALAATVVVAHAVLRWLGQRPVVAAVAASLFALSPAALQRLSLGHLFLFALFPVPLAVYAVVWATERRAPGSFDPRTWRADGWFEPRAWVVPVGALAVISLTSGYSAIFAVTLLAAVGLVGALRRGDARRLAAPILLILVLVGVAGVTLAPELLARRGDPAAASLARPVRDSDTYGLRPAALVLPRDDHPIGVLATWGERATRTRTPSDGSVALGVTGTVGLVAMAVVAIRRAGRPRDEDDHTVTSLALITASTLAIASVGAGGFVLATLGFTQARAWSRMSPFIMFCAFAALGLIVQRRVGRTTRFALVVGLVGVLALWDQGLPLMSRDRASAEHREDAALVAELERRLPDAAMIVALPVVTFPDDVGASRLLAPSLHTDSLRFTAGAFRGGPGDWQETWLDPGDDAGRTVRAAAATGADALLLQRTHHLVDDPDTLERQLAAAVGAEGHRSDRGTWTWFDLRPVRAALVAEHGERAVDAAGASVSRPLGVTYDGSAGREYTDGAASTLLASHGAVVVHATDGDRSAVTVTMRVAAAAGTTVRLRSGDEDEQLVPGEDGDEVQLEVPIGPDGTGIVRVTAEGDRLHIAGADGPARVQLSRVRVADSDSLTDPILG